jgi:hypothetical protein
MRKALTSPAIHFKGSGWAKKERATSRAKSQPPEEVRAEGGERDGDRARDRGVDRAGDGPATDSSAGVSTPSTSGASSDSVKKPTPASGRAGGTGAGGEA